MERPAVVIGRDAERARIDALFEDARRGRTGVLVIAGEPGIGKTALLGDACKRAAGFRVLRVTAAEAESSLPFAGLHALLQPLVGLLPRLESAQQRSLRTALALDEGEEPNVLAVNAGTLALLAEAAFDQPVLVVVDDAQWLDSPSAQAMAFAARRLEGEDLAFLLGVRTGESAEVDRGFPRLELGPLDRGDARTLLRERRERVPPVAVERMLDLAAGNPLAVLELPISVASEVAGDEVDASDRVRQAFAARLDTLDDTSRQALMLAAAEPDPSAVRRAAERLGLGDGALADAERAGLVRIEPDGVSFRHPLVRSLAYSSVGPVERRAAHRALAASLSGDSDRDRRAWHLAAAATEPDEKLAALLEETADRAEARGGHGAAARALERAARLSSDREAFARRLTRAARLASWSGAVDRALAMAEEALDATQDVNTRADVLLEIASVHGAQGVGYAQEQFLTTIAESKELDPDRSTRLLLTLVTVRGNLYDTTGAVQMAERLEASALQAGEWWKPRGLAVAATAHLAAGNGERFWSLLAETAGHEGAAASCALDLVWAERYDQARRALETTLREGRAAGNQMRVIWNQACFAHLELRLGRLSHAMTAAAEAIALADTHGMGAYAGIARCALAGIHAWRGDVQACRASATEALAAAREAWSVPDEFSARTALGLLSLGLGHPEEVIDELRPCAQRWEETGHVEPSGVPFVPDLVEAHIRCNELAEAEELLARFREVSEQTNRRWALSAVARCEGILAPTAASTERFERSLELLEATPLALDRARTQLAYGERLRRAGQRREARTQLRAAHAAFAAVDAAPWAERAAAELRATGESVGPRTPDRRGQLTPQELQISNLVAEGKTNKEIAAQLYLSPKTIEFHLGNAYRKLGVHSRVELVRAIAERA